MLLRTSGADYRVEPGVSDIDLTVIHSAGDAETLAFLDEFWSAYRQLKTWLPMLGEVEILSADEFALIARLAPRLAKIQKTYVPVSIARTFAGRDTLEAALRLAPVEPAVPHMLALLFMKFTTAILPRTFAVRADPSVVHRKRLDRQLTTAGETLSKALARLGVNGVEPGGGDDVLMRRAAKFYGDLGRCSAALAQRTFGPERRAIPQQAVDVPEELAQFAAHVFGDLDVSLLWSRPVCFPQTLAMAVVTEDDLEPPAFGVVADRLLRFRREAPAALRPLLSGNLALRHFRVDGWPFMIPRSTFRWFAELSPFYFPSFSLSRRPSIGGAPLEMIAASRATCERELLLHFCSFLSLKNNWQHSATTDARLALYRATIDYSDGFASVARGSGLTPPAVHTRNLLDTYRELKQSLQRLGEAVGNLGDRGI